MNSKALNQAYDAQNFAHDSLMRFKAQIDQGKLPLSVEDAKTIAALVKAWVDAQDRCRIIRGRPLPGSLRPERKTRTKPASPLVILDAPVEDSQATK